MGVLIWLLIGIVSGAIAISLLPGEDCGRALFTMCTCAVGALIGGWFGNVLAGRLDSGLSLWSLILAIVGAISLLGAYRSFAKRAR